MPEVYANKPNVPPTIDGYGKAWKIEVDRERDDWQPAWEAGVAQWLVEAPGAHPYWWWYVIATVSLRELPGVPPPHRQFPGATHEIMFLALNPERPLPNVEHWTTPSWMTPIDLNTQFIVDDDEQAAALTELVVRHIVINGASPDSDYRTRWEATIAKTAEHFRLGGHPDP